MKRWRQGFSLMELLVVVTVFTLLLALALPIYIYPAREASRKRTCSDNIRKLGTAMLEYEQTYKRFTSLNVRAAHANGVRAAQANGVQAAQANGVRAIQASDRWSGIIALLPYLKEDALYASFHDGTTGTWANQSVAWGPYGSIATSQQISSPRTRPDVLRYAWSPEYRPNRTEVGGLRCPSDPGEMRSSGQWNLARTNYAFCLGDSQIGINSGDLAVDVTRGAFQFNRHFAVSEFTSGTAPTVMFGEIATHEGSAFASENRGATEKDAKVQGRAIYELDQQPGLKGIDVNACRGTVAGGRYVGTKRNWSSRGTRAYDALPAYTGFNTINPPNAASCTPTNNAWGEGEGIYTAGSYHPGGAHVVTFDGSVKFINDGINTSFGIDYTSADYYSPGRAWINGKWEETPNWSKHSPFGPWGFMGTRTQDEW